MKHKETLFLFIGYTITSILLFLYSYTQVDLNLTLSQVSIWQTIQKAFQYIGFFQRPLSTVWYLWILFSLSMLYIFILRYIRKGLITRNFFWKLVCFVTVILLFSYPAFSYDIFNYMFTAKTVLVYHKNPYEVVPLQFTGVEPWLTFMRWTHLPSAYTPLWILLTLPAYLLGFGYFLLILWSVKLLAAVSFLATVWCIGKILDLIDAREATLGMAVFAFNPLTVIEALVGAHNDIAMMALAMTGIYLLLKGKRIAAFFVIALSIAMKFMTIFIVPLFFFRLRRWQVLLLMASGFCLVLFKREVLPWYFSWILPFVALMPGWWEFSVLSLGISIGLLLRYAPYLYLGHWNDPVPFIKLWVTLIPIIVSICVILWVLMRGKSRLVHKDTYLLS